MAEFYYSCACTAKDGKLKLHNVEAFNRGIFHAPNGADLELIIQERGRQRTSQQNRFFWGPVCNGFKELGYRPQETHDLLCLMFLPQQVKQLDGTLATFPGHTSTLTVKQFNEFLEQVIQLAAEKDIYIADADEWRKNHGAAA